METQRRLLGAVAAAAVLTGCGPGTAPPPEVAVYTSVDAVFARPIADRFAKQTGVTVKLVPDTEETKSTGLLNRLIAEKDRPQADVFWSGDPVRAAILKRRGVAAPFQPADPADTQGRFSDPEGYWNALSARARVILYNTNLVGAREAPTSLQDFLRPKWKGRACLANPLFGTTSMHAAALFEVWGTAKATAFFEGLLTNQVRMLSSNGEVRRRVAAGDFVFGLTDTDDANVAIQEGKPVAVAFPDADTIGTLIIPNAAVLIQDAPHPKSARRFIDFLLTPEVEQALAECEAAQMPLRPGVPVPPGIHRLDEIKAMKVDYLRLAARLETLSSGYLKTWVQRMRRP